MWLAWRGYCYFIIANLNKQIHCFLSILIQSQPSVIPEFIKYLVHLHSTLPYQLIHKDILLEADYVYLLMRALHSEFDCLVPNRRFACLMQHFGLELFALVGDLDEGIHLSTKHFGIA